MKHTSLLSLLLISVVLLLGCQIRQPDWPSHVLTSIWVPHEAKRLGYYTLHDSYQVEYHVKECYPGKSFIKSMVSEMTKRAWKRKACDFLNPTIPLNHTRMPGDLWSHIIDKDGCNVYQWIDDWQDSGNNIVRYWLKYTRQTRKNSERSVTLKWL